jgi:hypothetical protein
MQQQLLPVDTAFPIPKRVLNNIHNGREGNRVEFPIIKHHTNTFQYFPHSLTNLSDFCMLDAKTGGLQIFLEH